MTAPDIHVSICVEDETSIEMRASGARAWLQVGSMFGSAIVHASPANLIRIRDAIDTWLRVSTPQQSEAA